MQSKKLNKGEDSMKTCQIMLFGIGIAAAFEFRQINVLFTQIITMLRFIVCIVYIHRYTSLLTEAALTKAVSTKAGSSRKLNFELTKYLRLTENDIVVWCSL
jgi:hypothetical protein